MWKTVKKWVKRIWGALDFTRRAIANFLLLAIVIGVGVFLFSGSAVKLEEKTTLVIPISGNLVEQSSMGSREASIAYAFSGADPETRLRDVIRAMDLACTDTRIENVLVRVDDLGKAGFASLREIGEAMDRLKSAGKKTTVWSSAYSQKQYAIASHASEVFVHPMGSVLLTGLDNTRLYWGETLRKLGVNVHVFKAGAYKSFPETFVRKGPSEAALRSDRFWMDDVWSQFTEAIEVSRGLMPGAVGNLIDGFEAEVNRADGNMSQVALNANLVDGVRDADAVRDILLERQGGKKGVDALRRVDYLDYLASNPETNRTGKGIAVLTLEGDIRDGASALGMVGARTVSDLIQAARKDKNVAALVVRIDSPGGSAVASEMIRRELELVRKSGKPVVVSMGDMAASGGYWVSLAADTIVADPMTITGSVGVFGMMPTFENVLEKYSVGVGGAYTEWMARAKSAALPLDSRYERILSRTVERTYQDFLKLVSQSRHMPIARVEPLAQGRVYTGRQAHRLGLVDQLGGMSEAQKEARRLAKLEENTPIYWYEESPDTVRTWVEKLLLYVKAPTNQIEAAIKAPLSEAEGLFGLVKTPFEPLAHALIRKD